MYNHNPFRKQTLGQMLDVQAIRPVYNTFEIDPTNWYNSQYIHFYGKFWLHQNVQRWTHDTEDSLEGNVNF